MHQFRPAPQQPIAQRLSVRALPFLYLVLAALTLLLAAPPSQAQRRDFTGSYTISHVRPEADNVTLTLTLTVHNYSGADLRNAGVVLATPNHAIPGAQPTPIAAFPLIKDFPFHTDITLRQTITIPATEYARWNTGESPNLEFLKPDGHQGTIYEPIDLRREITPNKAAQ
jgi:hypothetical protein